jgi:hypothetical protein
LAECDEYEVRTRTSGSRQPGFSNPLAVERTRLELQRFHLYLQRKVAFDMVMGIDDLLVLGAGLALQATVRYFQEKENRPSVSQPKPIQLKV